MITIPSGKKVKFFLEKDGKKINLFSGENDYLVIDEDINISISSDFKPLISGPITNNAIQALGQEAARIFSAGFSGYFKEMTYQIWSGSQPIKVSFTTSIFSDKDAKKEVWNKVKKILKLPLPFELRISNTESRDVWGNERRGIGLLGPGPTLGSVLQKAFGEAARDIKKLAGFQSEEDTSGIDGSIIVQMGPLIFKDVIVTSVEPTFSKEIQKIGRHYYPISCRLSVSFESVYAAYQQAIDEIMPNYPD